MSTTYLNFIGGKWSEGSTGKWTPNRNPAKPQEILGQMTLSTEHDVRKAVDAAAHAQKEWGKTPRPVRGALLHKAAQLVREGAEAIANLITLEEGKNLTEARGEVQKTINTLEYTASLGRQPSGQVIPSEVPNTFVYTSKSPLGVVGVITPWNFPICIPAWKIGPALLEGNSVIYKPASLTPACAVALVECFEKAGLPPGVLNLVFGSGSVVGNEIASNPKIRAISFTGSNEIGTHLNQVASKRLAKVQLEMGGKNPILVCADADLDLAAAAAISGAFGSTGQRCTATSRVIVEKAIHAEFVQKLAELTQKITVSCGITSPQAMGPVVDGHQYQSVLKEIASAKQEGAKLVVGQEIGDASSIQTLCQTAETKGYFVAPTLFDHVHKDMTLAQKEVFGPVLAVIPVADFAEALEVANQVEYGLSASLYTRDIQKIMNYASSIETGIAHINAPTVGGEVHAPFGGSKATGTGGREMSWMGPEFFSEVKTVYINYGMTARKGNFY